MPRRVGPERSHFGGASGLITEIQNGRTTYHWKCMHCNFRIGGKCFPNEKARIHLSGDTTLRNGMIARVCDSAPDEVKAQFVKLQKDKLERKLLNLQKRKRAQVLLAAKGLSSPAKQARLALVTRTLADEVVDDCWGKVFLGWTWPHTKSTMIYSSK